MKDDIVTAAKWLGAALVLASVVLIGGMHWVLSTQVDRLREVLSPRQETAGLPVRVEVRPSVVSGDPVSAQVEKLMADAESLRLAGEEGERFWIHDQPSQIEPVVAESPRLVEPPEPLDPPSQLTPFRTHGGLGP